MLRERTRAAGTSGADCSWGAAIIGCRIRLPLVLCSAPQSVFTITEKAPTRAFSWLKAPTSAFTFKTLLRHYAKQALTPGK